MQVMSLTVTGINPFWRVFIEAVGTLSLSLDQKRYTGPCYSSKEFASIVSCKEGGA